MPKDWDRYRVFGDEHFDNGGAFICIDETDDSIRRVDVELDQSVGLFSASVSQFVTCFRLLDDYFASAKQSPKDLAVELRLTDTKAFDARSQWRLLSDYLL